MVLISGLFSILLLSNLQLEKGLVFKSLDVVENPRTEASGPWSFASVFNSICEKDDTSSCLIEWLTQWEEVSEINKFKVGRRLSSELLAVWPKLAGNIDLRAAPFQLLAIVFRPDLASLRNPAGEGRFVFGLIDPVFRRPLEFYVIVEIGLPITHDFDVQDWKDNLIALSGMGDGENRNFLLSDLTERFLRLRSPDVLNRPSLVVRTNDFYFQFEWELREFRYNAQQNLLKMSTTEQSPAQVFDEERADELAELLINNREEIFNGQFMMPAEILGGASVAAEESFLWLERSSIDFELRRKFSELTCNGCHSGATDTRFTHISNRLPGFESTISRFLENDLKLRRDALESLGIYQSRSRFRVH